MAAEECSIFCSLFRAKDRSIPYDYEDIAMKVVRDYGWDVWRDISVMILTEVFEEDSVNKE